jgi:CrcB protein
MIRPVRRSPEVHRHRSRVPLLPPLRGIGLVVVGGGIGTLARVGLSQAFPTPDGSWPWVTLIENVSGAFLLAVLLTVLTERVAARPWSRPLLGTGVLGAYTTFSTLAYEIERLGAGGRAGVAIGYAAVSVVAGLAAAVAGIMLVRWRGSRSAATT